MLNKFNTDKLNIMGIVRSLYKYLLIIIVFIFFLSSVIQTATYLQIQLSGDFSIDNSPTVNVNGTDYPRVSGRAYLTTLGAPSRERGWDVHYEEDAWAEVGSRNHNVEEMQEGRYLCTPEILFEDGCAESTAKNAFDEIDDEWTTQTSYHKNELVSLYHNGWVQIEFEPTPNDPSEGDFYIGFRGNPENNYRNAYKDPIEATTDIRNGFGLFLITLPSAESYIKEINIRDIGGDPTVPGSITFKSPVKKDDMNCAGSCTIDFNADFLSPCNDRTGWFGESNFTYTNYGRPSATYDSDDLTECLSYSFGIPYKIQMTENTASTGMDYKYAMPVVSLSPSSAFKSNNCRFCFSPQNVKTSYLWSDLFGWLESRDPDIYSAMTGGGITANNAQYVDQANIKLESDNDLPNNIERGRSPIALAFGYSYSGGDSWVWTMDQYWAGHGLVVNYSVASEYQVEIDFAQLGVRIDASTDSGVVSSYISTASGKDVNNDDYLWVYSPYDSESVTFFNDGNTGCMYDVLREKVQAVSGEDGMTISTTTANILRTYESTYTPESYFSSNDQVGLSYKKRPLALSNSHNDSVIMDANYHYYITNFAPAFELTPSPDMWADLENLYIGSYVNIYDITLGNDGSFTVPSFSSQTFDNNSKSCAFPEHLQQLIITPKVTDTDLYYVHAVATTNANVFTKSSEGYWREYTQTDIQFSIESTTVLAQALSTNNSEVIAEFKPFPNIYLASYIGSKIEGQVTSNPYDTNYDMESGSIFVVQNDSRTNLLIQPERPFELTFNSKLERLGIYGDEKGYIGLYKMESLSNEDAIDGTEVNYAGITYLEFDPDTAPIADIPDETESVVTIATKNISLSLEKIQIINPLAEDPEYEYKLSFESILDHFYIFIDFTPYIVHLYTTAVDRFEDTVTTTNIATNTGSSIYIKDDAYNYINDIKKAKANEEFEIQVNLDSDSSLQYNREDYYIFDILETYYLSDNEVSVNSRINENYSVLSNSVGQFVYFNYYSSSAITYETDIQFLIEKYKLVELTFNEYGSVEHEFSGLVQVGDSDYGSSRTYTTDEDIETFILKPNNVTTGFNQTSEVGFRRYDNLNLNLIPNPGYYIKSVILTIDENFDNDFDDEDDVTANILSTLPDFSDAVSAKSVEILTITKNIKVEVDFQEKPSIKSFFLSPFY